MGTLHWKPSVSFAIMQYRFLIFFPRNVELSLDEGNKQLGSWRPKSVVKSEIRKKTDQNFQNPKFMHLK